MTESRRPCLLLVGGSFNPPHIAHLRIALEVREALLPEMVLFIPVASPPHKSGTKLLPFHLRMEMLQKSVRHFPPDWNIGVSPVENERTGPSYTVDTLEILRKRHPALRLTFVMGAEDYMHFSSWRRWREIPQHADLAIVPRTKHAPDAFAAQTLRLWPQARALAFPGVAKAFSLPEGGRLLYLPQPLLEISSSLVRERFLAGRSLDFLVPPAVRQLLEKEAAALRDLWA